MANLRSDSPLSRQIVRSFLQFLNSVELAPDGDSEALVVASQCLADVFKVDASELDESTQPDLIHLFQQAQCNTRNKEIAESTNQPDPSPAPSIPGNGKSSASDDKLVDEKLFEQFKDGLESAGYFDGLQTNSQEYQENLKKARNIFSETLKKVDTNGKASEPHILAEAFKLQGNNSMANLRYNEAIDLYTMAISLCGEHAVYYSNRAAAHTQVGKYDAAISDSNKAIQLDPNYSKAYSRLGLAYYGQGKYAEAIEKGFTKAQLLDPNNKSIQENLQVAQKKLDEERSRSSHTSSEPSQQDNSNPDPNHHEQQQNSNPGSESRFSTSIPLNFQIPPGMAELFPGVANMAAQFAGETLNRASSVNVDGQEPTVNIHVNGEQQFAGLMQSMLQMLGGGGQTRNREPDGDRPSES